MTIAQGQTYIQAERYIVVQGFTDQLEILHKSQTEQENNVKAKLYDIIANNSITKEEKRSLESPLYVVLEDIAEKHNRIRSSLFIGLYSFWEVSLNAICERMALNTNQIKPKSRKNANKDRSKVWMYLNSIYGDTIPDECLLIDGAIRMLRNYMVHGNLSDSQKYDLREFCKTHTEFSINESCGTFVISNYKGLEKLLNVISNELLKAERKNLLMTK
ncbi:MAG: hypothetical protein NC453_06665 [Muribaculum sp.]|nr:hypothetical protein [Muribaculum sp.]